MQAKMGTSAQFDYNLKSHGRGSQQVNEERKRKVEGKEREERWLNWWSYVMNHKPIRKNDSVR